MPTIARKPATVRQYHRVLVRANYGHIAVGKCFDTAPLAINGRAARVRSGPEPLR